MLAAIGLRMKLWGLAALGVLLLVGGLWVRLKFAKAKAAKASARADALDAARETERRIATKRTELTIRQSQIREELAARKIRDSLDGQGWGP